MSKAAIKHTWAFGPRFRSGSFGWRSEPAITRIKEAVSEIKAVARKEPVLAAEGAVLFLQKVSPALQNIDSSSGAIGTAVNRAIDALVPIIAKAPADPKVRRKWLEQLYQAHADDQIPYIECLGDYWGELCSSREISADWADRLAETVDTVWSRSKVEHGFYHGTSMCLSAMLAAGRHDQLLTLLDKCPYKFWSYRQWGVKALAALGKKAEALRYAEESRGLNDPLGQIAETCEAILISSGLKDEAYQRYAFEANHGGTYLATFRAICRKYPHKAPEIVLNDLVARTPGEEGKWFAAAKDAELFDLALNLAKRSPVDHRTLIRATEDFAEKQPGFALNCGLMALYWICAGRAYEATTGEVLTAYTQMLRAAEFAQCTEAAMDQLRKTLESFPQERFVRAVLATVLANKPSLSVPDR
jgi:tetratricopeptide (TPR) repeat protein